MIPRPKKKKKTQEDSIATFREYTGVWRRRQEQQACVIAKDAQNTELAAAPGGTTGHPKLPHTVQMQRTKGVVLTWREVLAVPRRIH